MTNKTATIVCKFSTRRCRMSIRMCGKDSGRPRRVGCMRSNGPLRATRREALPHSCYNPEANGKIERGHGPIVKALVRACNERVGNWPQLLPYALWADRTTHSSVIGYMPAELMYGQKTVMPIEKTITSWVAIPWENEMSREELSAA